MNYRKINNLSGVIVLFIALFVYMKTLEPSTSLWDCGEYISTSNKLEVGHPPGAPSFALLGRLISAFSAPEDAAYMVNSLSAISSALTIMFLFWTITYLAKKFMMREEKELSKSTIIAIIGSGVVGALAYMFSDTFWFSSEEGEVYAMSSFFTALTFWVILKWEEKAHEPSSDRWIVLIFFLIGFAIGVHLLNLLVIPTAAFVIYFKKHEFTYKGFLITGVIALGVLVFMNFIFISSTLSIADKFERFFNGMGFGFNTGAFIFFIFLAVLLGAILFYAHKTKNRILHVITLSFTVLVIGFSTFSVVVVRSNSNPPLDENNPETMPMLMSYLGREQYGETPLFKGPFWNSPQKMNTGVVKKNKYFKAYTVFYKRKEYSFQTEFEAKKFKERVKSPSEIIPKYVISGYYYEDTYPPGASDQYTILPRMFSPNKDKIGGYMFWSGYEGKFGVKAKDPKIQIGKNLYKDKYLPSKSENFRYMTDYQFGWMYFRYFLWNFVGRQNDIQGHNQFFPGDGMLYKGALTRGNWLSGVNFIDKERVGTQDNLPQTMSTFEAYNTYYYLPLILGLLGLVFMIVKAPKDAFLIFLLFLFTGLAIVFYLNQKPYEPRERDYAYAASFYAFAIWIGFGVLAIFKWAQLKDIKEMKNGVLGALGAGVLFFIVEMLNGSNHAFSYSILFMSIVGILMVIIPMFVNKTLKNTNYLAIMSVGIGLVIPIIMGVQNWDDHDRSDRYFAREIAKNYLNSCDNNAILFCFGDNDTFPLWYAQEVEGIRTDMKVMNYSLLSSDWHYLQLKRKTYDADAIPTVLDEPDFRAGTRDVVFLSPSNKSISANQLMKYMKNGQDLNTNDSKYGHSRIPFNKVYIDVDKEACLKNGLIREDQKNSLVNRIEWTFSGRYLSKADLALVDILAAYKWDRPLYFTSNSIQGANSGLRNYLQSEGMTYKFIPIKNPTPYKEKMYSLLMGEKVDFNGDSINDGYNWGNIEKDEVFADYYTMRMIRGARSSYLQLAERLQVDAINIQNRITRGLDSSELSKQKVIENNKKSLQLLDKMFESFPVKSCKLDQMLNYSISLYKRGGDSLKSKALAEEFAEYYNENVEYFSYQNDEYIQLMYREISSFMGNFDQLVQLTDDNKYNLKVYNPEAYNRLAIKIGNIAKSNGSFAKNLKDDIMKMYQTQRPGMFSPDFYSVATPFLMPRAK